MTSEGISAIASAIPGIKAPVPGRGVGLGRLGGSPEKSITIQVTETSVEVTVTTRESGEPGSVAAAAVSRPACG